MAETSSRTSGYVDRILEILENPKGDVTKATELTHEYLNALLRRKY